MVSKITISKRLPNRGKCQGSNVVSTTLIRSTLHSPTSPIGFRLDSLDSDRILSSPSSVRAQSNQSPIRVQSESELSPIRVQAQTHFRIHQVNFCCNNDWNIPNTVCPSTLINHNNFSHTFFQSTFYWITGLAKNDIACIDRLSGRRPIHILGTVSQCLANHGT